LALKVTPDLVQKLDENFFPKKEKVWWEVSYPVLQKLGQAINITKGIEDILPSVSQSITTIGTAVEMYINPQNISYEDSKIITPTRTKGGYIIQYWGEELGTINLSGHTSSAGIEGINLLRMIYRIESIVREAGQIAEPCMAKLATNVKMHYRRVSYKGFFRSMAVTESSERIGLFDYTMNFAVTSVFGRFYEENFMNWHKDMSIATGSYAVGVGSLLRIPIKLK